MGIPLSIVVLSIVGSFLPLLDSTVVNVSLDATARSLGGLSDVQWVVTAYLLALAASMPLVSWMTRRFGIRTVFASAVGGFAAGSAMCAFAPTLQILVAGRVVSGLAGGVLAPAATILLVQSVPRERIAKVQALSGSVMLVGPLLGPTIGGLLIEAGGWPAVYWVNLPICGFCLVRALRTIPRNSDHRQQIPLDKLGAVTGSAAAVLLVLAIHLMGVAQGLTQTAALVLAGAVATGMIFVRCELRQRAPMTDLRLLSNRIYRLSASNVFMLGFVLYGPMVVMPLYLQLGRGNSSVTTGLLLSVGGAGVLGSAAVSSRAIKRFGCGATMLFGITLTLVSTAPLLSLRADTSYTLILACLVVRGAGVGMTIVPAMTSAFASIPSSSVPDASPQLNLLQRIGGAISATLVTVAVQHSLQHPNVVPGNAFGTPFAWVLGTSFATLVPAVLLALAERARHREGDLPQSA
ncbi:DHA2 family efflux MFS transporter permease subunit [Flexivirga meconopsidis]|uniref:DHA2 family efflux MFS transporter permease subunit n=1 Tax=Flexivirga meconopsidis TaxID=2977121 RepID=UPI00223F74B5|nr:DHA2 family efflux MFS transporter permease subunit [Flexivirga meconopsidis]